MMRGRGVGVVLALSSLLACSTLETRTNPGYDGPRTYSGTRRDAAGLGIGFANLSLPIMMLYSFGLPFSMLADTALLPLTLVEERNRRAGLEDALRAEQEAPSAISTTPGASPLAQARRLFRTCSDLLSRLHPELVDCYSIHARIHQATGEEIAGAEYKRRVHAALARGESASDFVRLRDPAYTVEGEHVRIEATRISSQRFERPTVTLIVGPGPDGGWRILEETGVDWPPVE